MKQHEKLFLRETLENLTFLIEFVLYDRACLHNLAKIINIDTQDVLVNAVYEVHCCFFPWISKLLQLLTLKYCQTHKSSMYSTRFYNHLQSVEV
jgi:hypothetical protein